MRRTVLLAATALLAAACAPPASQPSPDPGSRDAASSARPPASSLETADTGWIASWGTAPGSTYVARDSRYRKINFRNVTVRQVVRLSAGGKAVRLRLTNEFGDTPLEIGAASIALVDADGATIEASIRPLTFGGKPSTSIAPGAPLLTDPIAMEIDDLTALSISLYLTARSRLCSCHDTGLAYSDISPPGDYTATTFEPLRTTDARAFITGVEVLAQHPARTLVAFGDSITDGMGSTYDANRRWPDILAERFAARANGSTWAVVNAGISGNKLLVKAGGPSALSRFDRDVLARPGVSHVIVFIGVNDLGDALSGDKHLLTANDMIAGYRQLIARAHASNLKIFGATIAPYEGFAYWSERGEAARQAINAWMRDSGEFDAVLDFAAVLADPNHPSRMADALHSGDRLHGSDAGYRALAQSIDLGLFN